MLPPSRQTVRKTLVYVCTVRYEACEAWTVVLNYDLQFPTVIYPEVHLFISVRFGYMAAAVRDSEKKKKEKFLTR